MKNIILLFIFLFVILGCQDNNKICEEKGLGKTISIIGIKSSCENIRETKQIPNNYFCTKSGVLCKKNIGE